jgi:predicted nucleotidyltransferase
MEQILYIILELAKRPNHVRGIAKTIGMNHMTVSRALRDMYSKNIIDYELQGKNKVYKIKNTIDARNYLVMAESYALINKINQYPILRKIVKNIQSNNNIKLIILFGSYAKNLAKSNSDIDIFIKTKDRDLKKEIEQLNTKISVKIGSLNDEILSNEIKKDHIILKGAEQYYDKYFFKKIIQK